MGYYWASLLLFVAAALILVQLDATNGWLEEEKRGLLDIKHSLMQQINITNAFLSKKYISNAYSTMKNHSSFLSSWVSDDSNSDSCGWERVTCDSSSHNVIHLSLHNLTNQYQEFPYDDYYCLGSVSNFNMSLLLSFKHLTTFNLSYNCFDGLFGIQDDGSNSKFTMLETLDLSWNDYLNESVMKPLTAFTSLKNLNLANCNISGPFPINDTNSLSKLEKLTTLDLSDNYHETMDIFKYLVALPALKHLFLRSSFWEVDGILKKDSGLCKLTQLQELDLSYNDLKGTLENACLPNLTSLRALDLSVNSFSGNIPSSLFSPLVSLEFLSLSSNYFEGLFPLSSLANNSKLKVLSLANMGSDTKAFHVETENCPWIPSFQLEYLDLSYSLSSSPSTIVPSFLSYQHDLKYIVLSNNNLVGMFPSWLLVNNSRLTYLFLDHNSFTELLLPPPSDLHQSIDQLLVLNLSFNKLKGKLPINIGCLFPYLKFFRVSSNMFDGEIPTSIGEMSNLTLLDLSHNSFSGEIPKDILRKCISVLYLDISNNNLQGNLFSTLMNLESLGFFGANNNQFNGTLEGGHFSSLRSLDISSNNFSGMLPSWIVNSHIRLISASSNNFEGVIPLDLCKNEFLHVLDLSRNRFLGEIPPCIFNLTSLSFLDLRSNSLTGTIPEILSEDSSFQIIDLSDNEFTGTIPESFYRLARLNFLLLANNKLKGQLSSQICRLSSINILDLSHNYFIGSIPSCFNNMSFGKDPLGLEYASLGEVNSLYFYNSHFKLYQDFFMEFDYRLDEVQLVTKGLTQFYKGDQVQRVLSGLDLSFNQLTGKIPQEIGFLQELYALNLSHNHLSGSIPESLHNLSQIESLDLSYNNLTGEIPFQLQELHYLSAFNVCYNNLSGRAPDQGQFANFDDNNYRRNPNLWWSNTNRRTQEPPTQEILLNETQGSEFPIDLTAFY